MPAERRLWDSSVIIGYLAGQDDLRDACEGIIRRAEQGEVEVLASAMATIEVAYLDGLDDRASEEKISEFFSRNYIIPVAIDMRVSTIARGLIRKYRTGPKLKPPDAAHLATAIQWRIPVIETTDPDLLRLDEREGAPDLIIIRKPLYEGTIPMRGL